MLLIKSLNFKSLNKKNISSKLCIDISNCVKHNRSPKEQNKEKETKYNA